MTRSSVSLWLSLALLACGGAEPAPKPVEAAPPPIATPAPTPEPEAAPPVDLSTMSVEQQQAYLMELGKAVYDKGGSGGIACTTCHGPEGKGTPGAFPSLVGQKDLMGSCAQHAGYVVKGLTGKIMVDGVQYDGVMPAQANLSDLEIAAVISYERNSWGNSYGFCMPADVAAVR